MIGFKDFLEEQYIYTKDGKIKSMDLSDIHPRCTNVTLKAFGICSTKVQYTNHDVVSELKRAGYNIIDLRSTYQEREDLEEAKKRGFGRLEGAHSGRETFQLQPNVAKDMYWNWKKLNKFIKDVPRIKTVNNMMSLLPKGKYIVGTRNHSMAYIDGKLYDFAAQGINKRKINFIQMVVTNSELKKFLQDTPTYKST